MAWRYFLNIGQPPASFRLFLSASQHTDKYSTKFDYKKIDDLLWIGTWDSRMEGAEESTEPPTLVNRKMLPYQYFDQQLAVPS